MENDIQKIKINKSDRVFRFALYDENDKDTGEYLQFDLEDIETALNFQEAIELHKKNIAYLKNQEIIIKKQQDHKGKKLLSSNEEAMAKTLREFYQREIKAMDLFIGKGKTQVILNIMGRNPYINMFSDISELLEPIYPLLEKGYKDFKNDIESKYNKEVDVLE